MIKSMPLTINTLHLDDSPSIGLDLHELITELYPICRSITGNGVRESLKILQNHIPVKMFEVPSGTPVFDWIVPQEWNIREAYVKNSQGEKIIDFRKSNLHVLNYSIPIHQKVSLQELKEHLFSIPEHPEWIPYRTSYYRENWGFCLSHHELQSLEEDEYEVFIDSSLEKGSLTYGEYYLPGQHQDEIILSCHHCHPSLCNDNLSGMAVTAFVARYLTTLTERQYSYRFLFIPGTIGSITWLCLNQQKTQYIKHGLVISGVGDSGTITYKKSRRGNAEIDRAAIQILKDTEMTYQIEQFSPYGYDERQYCSPGFNLPVGRFSRTPFGQYPEYHTSADNLNFVKAESLEASYLNIVNVLDLLENNFIYINTHPYCEPQLGKRGLYGSVGGEQEKKSQEMAILWILNLSDGKHSLLDIAERSGLKFAQLQAAAQTLYRSGLLIYSNSSVLEENLK